MRLGPGPPAKVEPMRIKIKPVSTPYITKARHYSADQRNYMGRFVQCIVEYSMENLNPHAEWASPPLLVVKPGTEKYRLKLYLRRVNQ